MKFNSLTRKAFPGNTEQQNQKSELLKINHSFDDSEENAMQITMIMHLTIYWHTIYWF